ncbi:hypothetical protein [Synechococcus sp. A15-24]|uniref:hypothetical protein n=1 Tax=Synechococcus sp. A15-24 TaxID=1050635 RepID=UPI00164932AF|nr:hypothetical protein [Synechococcus sp. A15-24]
MDIFIYKDGQGNNINALLSVKAERQLLKTIQMPSLPIQARMQLAMSRISA